MITVMQYIAAWNSTSKKGDIKLALANGTIEVLQVSDASELMMLMDMLRNENPVFYDKRQQTIQTGGEHVGEQET